MYLYMYIYIYTYIYIYICDSMCIYQNYKKICSVAMPLFPKGCPAVFLLAFRIIRTHWIAVTPISNHFLSCSTIHIIQSTWWPLPQSPCQVEDDGPTPPSLAQWYLNLDVSTTNVSGCLQQKYPWKSLEIWIWKSETVQSVPMFWGVHF